MALRERRTDISLIQRHFFHKIVTNFIFSVNVPQKADLKKAVAPQALEFVVYLL